MSALDGAERKGREAYLAGKPRSACPYEDKRGHWHNMIAGSRAFIKALNDGWDNAKKCGDTHIFDLGDDAVCDICGIPKSEIVDMDQYRKEWADRLDRNTS
jgi:ribosome modulation factor